MAEALQPGLHAPALTYRRGVVLVLLAGVCWSIMGLGVRLMEAANVWQILFYRSCALAPLLFVLMAVRSKGTPVAVIRRAGLAGVIGGLALVAAFSGGIYAIQTTTVANALFLFASAPFFAALLGRVILGESVRSATWIAMAVATLGIVVMVAEGIALGHLIGNSAAIFSALGFAVFTVALRWRKLEDMLPAVFLAGVFAIIVSAAMSFAADFSLAVSAHDLAIALFLGFFQLGLGLTLYTFGSKAVPAAELALLSMTEVVLGSLWVWIFLGEKVAPLTLLGGAILLGAIAGNAITGARRKPTPVM